MTFPQAIAEATIGNRISRPEWPEDEYGFFDEFLMIHRHGKDFIWQVSKGDAVEEDWEIF
jgi:hypothetical protein